MGILNGSFGFLVDGRVEYLLRLRDEMCPASCVPRATCTGIVESDDVCESQLDGICCDGRFVQLLSSQTELDYDEAVPLIRYFRYIMSTFAHNYVTTAIASGSGMVTERTVQEWLF